jgi:hypothetical protein
MPVLCVEWPMQECVRGERRQEVKDDVRSETMLRTGSLCRDGPTSKMIHAGTATPQPVRRVFWNALPLPAHDVADVHGRRLRLPSYLHLLGEKVEEFLKKRSELKYLIALHR